MRVALLYSSKNGMAESLVSSKSAETWKEEEDEPPPDMLAECDSDETIQAIGRALSEKHEVFPIESDEQAYDHLRRLKPDLVFNIAERLVGPSRESHIPVLCEILGIPYTGSDPLTLGICLDKSRAKEILTCHDIPNPPFLVADSVSALPREVSLPAIVKPLYEGSSKGIKDNSVVRTREALAARVAEITGRYGQPVIVEKFLDGREFTVGVLGNHPHYEVLPIVEIDHSLLPAGSNPIYSYEAKWLWDTPQNPLAIFRCPADIPPELAGRIADIVKQACRILRVRDWCRVDVRLDDKGQPHILELNPLPGVLPNPEENSCLPKAARTAGYTYSGLILRVAQEAAERCGLNHE